MAVAFAVCAKAVTVLATCGVVDRAFETGGVLIVTHVATSWDVLFSQFNTQVHGPDVPPKMGIRVRCKPDLRDKLIQSHMETCKGATPGCRLDPNPDTYTHVCGVIDITYVVLVLWLLWLWLWL